MIYTTREIGKVISEYRKKQQLTGSELASMMQLSQSKISKIETGYYSQLRPVEIQKIMNILKVPVIISQQILRSITDDTQKHDVRRYYEYSFFSGLSAEIASKTVRIYCNTIVPALLQTTSFRKAFSVANGIEDQLPTELQQIMLRQDQLWEGTRKYELIMPEMVLYSFFASREVHLGQLDRIERTIGAPNVRIGIIPLEAGTVPSEYGAFALYDERMVVDAITTGEVESTSRNAIRGHLEIFERLSRIAYYGDDAVALIRKAAQQIA